MKNKKLFAILTLVCFMFTLMPVAAFAADGYGYIEEDFTAVKVNEAIEVKVTTGGTYYVYAVKDGELAKVTAVSPATTVGENIGLGIAKATVAANEAISVKIAKAGEYTIGVADASKTALSAVVEGTTLVAPETVLSNLNTFKVDMLNSAVTVEAVAVGYEIAVTAQDNNVEATNGFDKAHQTVKLTTVAAAGSKAIPNADLEIVTDSYAIEVVKVDSKTRADGSMRFYVTGTIPGNYNVYVSHPNAETPAVIAVAVSAATIDEVTVAAQPTAPQDITATTADAGIVFKIADSTGYAYTSGLTAGSAGDYIVSVLEAPKGFSKTQTLKLKYEAKSATQPVAGWEIVAADGATPVALDKEGVYTFQVALKNGETATASVTVDKFDKAVALQFVGAPTTVPYGKTVTIAPTLVKQVDANGVQKSASITSLSANGKAIDTFNATSGELKAKNDEKFIGSTVTILAVSTDGKLTATTEVTVVDQAATIAYANKNVEVGTNATLAGKVYDENGKAVEISGSAQVIVLDKPANAVVSVSATKANPATVTKGNFTTSFLASAAGEYKIQTIVTTGTEYISAIETITVGGVAGQFNDVVVVSLGADSMIINNEVVKLDVAPFIENNRTMMQFNVLYVFGIDVQWVAETQSIVAEGNGLKVVMQLGSKVATVNGAEVALDVAPYSVNGRTVVPVGFITGTFGINPTFTYNADGTIADILFTK